MVAGGCNIVVFTTGRGTPTGHALAPVLKVTGNRETYQRMEDNMDFDASAVTMLEKDVPTVAQDLLRDVLATCSGRTTKAEAYGFSDIAVDHVCRFV